MSSFEISNLFGVKGKVVLVTGGSRGVGKMVRLQTPSSSSLLSFKLTGPFQIATGFVKNGAKVYISSRSAKDCDATASELNALGPGTCIALPADLQHYKEVERLAGELAKREKALHVLVNNAGATWGASVDDHPDSAWTKILTLNVQRVFTLTQLCLPLLRAAASQAGMDASGSHQDPARIINVSLVMPCAFV